ncbi:MAG: D-alanyl-D-alanine carboxypeptidase [Actinobacteria bacterium]|nr:D-alanyl-D-alanine carboxypeptidase [Actinomycetota bacterium]
MQLSTIKKRNRLLPAALLVLALTATSFSTFSASGDEVIGGGRLGESGVIFDDTKGDGIAAPPDTLASSFIIADLDSGEILAAKNPHKKLPPASTLKTLTALTLLPRLGMNKIYVGTKKEPATIGNKVGIYPGRKYKIKDIWYGLMLHSGNDAAVALANASGGIKKTAALMQAKAESIQAFDTTPKSPHGLDTPGQLSSAYDLALITRAAMNRSDFRKIVKTKRYTFPKSGPKNRNRKIHNLNKLLFTYPGTLGVKTGWTTKGQNTYIGVVKRDGHTIIITFMHLKYGRDALAKELFNWGFKAIGVVDPIGKLV